MDYKEVVDPNCRAPTAYEEVLRNGLLNWSYDASGCVYL
jgi:hypothetical protein